MTEPAGTPSRENLPSPSLRPATVIEPANASIKRPAIGPPGPETVPTIVPPDSTRVTSAPANPAPGVTGTSAAPASEGEFG